jgi:15-cis-phytoene synthase
MLLQYREQSWEENLLSFAYEAGPAPPRDNAPARPEDESWRLKKAYADCEAITAQHSRSFFLATTLLPFQKRRAVRSLYAFCRTADNIVDADLEDPLQKLARWRERSLSPHPPASDSIAFAWADTRNRYRLPVRYAEQLLEGVERDLRQNRYDTFEDLAVYCYGVAATVGLMSMHITGYQSQEAISYAVKLGVALQLTNILRDVGEDWQAGRLYLPLEELAAFNLSEADIANRQVDGRWRDFMRFQIERNRHLYAEAWPGIELLHPDGRPAVAAAATLYGAILDEIEAHDYDVFNRRAQVKNWNKLLKLSKLWLNKLSL